MANEIRLSWDALWKLWLRNPLERRYIKASHRNCEIIFRTAILVTNLLSYQSQFGVVMLQMHK